MAKVIKVTCTFTYVAIEEDGASARLNAKVYAREHLRDARDPFTSIETVEITSKEDVPSGWLNSIPYGDECYGDRRVYSYLPGKDSHAAS